MRRVSAPSSLPLNMRAPEASSAIPRASFIGLAYHTTFTCLGTLVRICASRRLAPVAKRDRLSGESVTHPRGGCRPYLFRRAQDDADLQLRGPTGCPNHQN